MQVEVVVHHELHDFLKQFGAGKVETEVALGATKMYAAFVDSLLHC